jgi:hypothetical protein
MGALIWFCFCACVTAYTVANDAAWYWIVLNVVCDISALVGAVKALSK